ncbi:hypothetical protein OV450_5277 [Actinobacteria bacterium OV450]|nr:hypothetical protein OV450_5277 [Actinobacteria bacterium OV450]
MTPQRDVVVSVQYHKPDPNNPPMMLLELLNGQVVRSTRWFEIERVQLAFAHNQTVYANYEGDTVVSIAVTPPEE